MRKFTVTVNGQDYDVVVKDSGAAAAPRSSSTGGNSRTGSSSRTGGSSGSGTRSSSSSRTGSSTRRRR